MFLLSASTMKEVEINDELLSEKSEIPEFKSGKMCPFCDEIKYENVERHISGHIFGTIKAGKNLEMLEYFEEKIGYNYATMEEIMKEIEFEEVITYLETPLKILETESKNNESSNHESDEEYSPELPQKVKNVRKKLKSRVNRHGYLVKMKKPAAKSKKNRMPSKEISEESSEGDIETFHQVPKNESELEANQKESLKRKTDSESIDQKDKKLKVEVQKRNETDKVKEQNGFVQKNLEKQLKSKTQTPPKIVTTENEIEVSNQTKTHKKVANKSEKEEKSDELDENLRFFEENLSESDNIEENMEKLHEDSENQSSLENTKNGNFGCRYLRLDFFLNLH